MNAAIEVKNLCFAYKNRPQILNNISFCLEKGGFLSIAGPNGAGKTTLLNLLSGLLKPAYGSIKIDSIPICAFSINQLARKIAVVGQGFVPVFDFSVRQVVAMARTPWMSAFAFESQFDQQAINDALEITGLSPFADRTLNQLSGGERQLVFIARAFAQQSPILLLDEPTTFLDIKHQLNIYDLLKKMQFEKQKTILAVTHDINFAAQYSDMILLLEAGGGFTFGPTREILTSQRIESVFGVKIVTSQINGKQFFFPPGAFRTGN